MEKKSNIINYKVYFFTCTPYFNTLNCLRCGLYSTDPVFVMHHESTDRHIVTLLKKGNGSIIANKKTYILEEGTSFIMFPGFEYTLVSDKKDPWEYFSVEVYGNVLRTFLQLSELIPEYPLHKHSNPVIINIIIDEFIKHCKDDIRDEIYRISLLHRYFTEIINDVKKQNAETQILEHVHSNKYISKAINYIVQNYEKEITVDNIAEYIGLNRSYFCRLFKNITGKTPSAYIKDYGMSRNRFIHTA